KTGVTVEDLSKLKFAAEQSGSSFDGLQTALRGLANNMEAAAAGSKSQEAAFKALGVSATDASGNLRPMNDVLLDVADKFKTMPDGATKSALAMDIFGRSGLAMIPMLDEGSAGIKAMGDQAQRLGIVFTGEAAKGADEFNDAQHALRVGLEGLGT